VLFSLWPRQCRHSPLYVVPARATACTYKYVPECLLPPFQQINLLQAPEPTCVLQHVRWCLAQRQQSLDVKAARLALQVAVVQEVPQTELSPTLGAVPALH
jgi:hypothetical protein